MSAERNLALGVETTLLNRILAKVSPTVAVAVLPGKSNWSPPAVNLTRCTSALLGRMVAGCVFCRLLSTFFIGYALSVVGSHASGVGVFRLVSTF